MGYRFKIEVTTFRGISIGAIHYYGRLLVIGLGTDYKEIRLNRPITAEEIESNPKRWEYYRPGVMTECFETWCDVLKAAKVLLDKDYNGADAMVEGIPNNDDMLLSVALNNKIDTSLRCCKCGKKIVGGMYNTPRGVLCIECYDKYYHSKK